MNYLSHGRNVTDSPWMLVGTAAPDWLRASRRRSRLMPDRLPDAGPSGGGKEPAPDPEGDPTVQLVAGIRKHMADDLAFHASDAFAQVNQSVAQQLRDAHPTLRRTGFLAHILIEILLDAWLMRRDPTLVDRYYSSLDELDADAVARAINAYAGEPSPRLANWFEGFRRIQFLRTYRDDSEVVARLEGVARRVSLPGMPPGFERSVHAVRLEVARRAQSLLLPTSAGA